MYVLLIYGILSILTIFMMLKENEKIKRISYVLCEMVCLFFALRFSVGRDLKTYSSAFENVSSFLDFTKFTALRNPGFNAFIYMAKSLFKTFPMYMLCVNVLCFALLCVVIGKNSKNVLLSLLIVIGGGMLEVYMGSGLRQAISMALFLFAYYEFLLPKKYKIYLLFCLLSFSFHDIGVVSILPLILDLLANRIYENKRKWLIAGVVLTAGLFLLTAVILPRYATQIYYATNNIFLMHIALYFTESGSLSVLGIGMETVFLIMIITLTRLSKKDDRETRLEFLTIFVSVLLYFGFAKLSIFSRLADYLQIIFVIQIPNLISTMKDKKLQMLALTAILGLHGFLLFADLESRVSVITLMSGEQCTLETYPYFTVFDDEQAAYYVLDPSSIH